MKLCWARVEASQGHHACHQHRTPGGGLLAEAQEARLPLPDLLLFHRQQQPTPGSQGKLFLLVIVTLTVALASVHTHPPESSKAQTAAELGKSDPGYSLP